MPRKNNRKAWDGQKRSAFEKKKDKQGSEYFKGWVLTKAGMIDITVFPNKDGEIKKTKKDGREYMYCLAICKNRYAFNVTKLDAYYYMDEGKVHIKEVDVVCSLKGGGQTANGRKVSGSVTFIDYNY